jgi:predicted mannosyl-3-phosphoglycerate phosphatase (HAD superfamily)
MQGLRVVSGGRFQTVTGAGSNKGNAIARLVDIYRQQYGDIITIGLGNSANDQPMLEAVDQAYLVQNPGGVWQEMDMPGLRRVAAVGPRGWRQVIEELLSS